MRKPEPEKDRSERYLLTYADLMNLLLILFIVLFCASAKDIVKTSAVLQSIKEGFVGGGAKVYSSAAAHTKSSSKSNAQATSSETNDYSDFYDQLIALLQQRGVLNKVDITAKNNEVVISLRDNVLFAPGKADLSNDSVSLLTTMGTLISKLQYGQIAIEGHTDSDPIHNAQFQNNRQLSLMRAYQVSEVFEKCGIDPKKLLPVGYGEYYPVAPNDTPANKAKNRRVVISILRRGITPADDTVAKEDLSEALNSSSSSAASSKSVSSSKISASSKKSGTSPASSK